MQLNPLESLVGQQMLLTADLDQLNTNDWVKNYQPQIDKLLNQQGALLIRGLIIQNVKQFAYVLQTLFDGSLLNYTYRSTPRTEVYKKIYTATEYPDAEVIPQHNENAYANQWPMRLGLLCMQPATEGGETPLADSRLIYQKIPQIIKDKFAQKGVKYVRNYGSVDLPWQEVFQTNDKDQVAKYCHQNQLSFQWRDKNTLSTSQINPAVAEHPVTGEMVWFNQAHLFHVSNLPEATREHLLSLFSEDTLPRNSYYGDGTSINYDDLAIIRDIYDEITLTFPWQKGDLMILDNMLYTHGRRPFSGKRKVLVGMARAHGWAL